MAIGDQNDIFSRLQQLLPPSWFGSAPIIVNAILQGYASALAFAYSLYAYAKLQTRILTATDGWLDLISADFFGTSLPRNPGQSDASFLARIRVNLFGLKATRQAVANALVNLTGRTPQLFEPMRPADTGAYGLALGYGSAGGYGSMSLPYQAFVIAFRPTGAGIPYVSGYANPASGYGVGYGEYASISMMQTIVTDADIYATIAAVIPFGVTAWAAIEN